MTSKRKFASKEDFETVIKNCRKKCIVSFIASWCAPCQIIMPHLEVFAKKYPNLLFYKVDIDEIDIIEHAYINSIPTFYVMKEGFVVDSLVGACEQRLESLIERHHNSENNNSEV